MKKLRILPALILALVLTTATYAESGTGKTGLFEGSRSEDSRRDKNREDDRGKTRDEGLEIETEDGVTFTKEHGKDGERVKLGSGGSIEGRRERAMADIDRRIASLNKLETRIEQMVRVSDSTKKSLKATVDTEIDALTALKEKIKNETDEAVLKADIQSISKAYRVYMLVMPQASILAAADRITTTADLMTTFGAKLDARIQEAASAGKDVSALTSAYTDMKVQLSEAKTQAAAAITLSAGLKPDNGDKSLMEANKKAMTEARAKIKAGHDDLKAARKDAEVIIKGLKSFNIKVEGSVKGKSEDR